MKMGVLSCLALALGLVSAAAMPDDQKRGSMGFKVADVGGIKVFYREAGDPSKPTIVLLQGFPSSSHQYSDLIPLLADRFHVLAPDYPGMGYSDAPSPTLLQPTFDDVARVIDTFIAQRVSEPFIFYLHDIGGQIGMRIATAHPERIAGLILQNFTLTEKGWNPERLKTHSASRPRISEKLREVDLGREAAARQHPGVGGRESGEPSPSVL